MDADDIERSEDHARTMRQHFEREWMSTATDRDTEEYWIMQNARATMRKATVKPDGPYDRNK